MQYSPFGAATAWNWGNGGSYSRTLDGDGRIASYTVNGFARTLGYDAASRLTSISDAALQSFNHDNLDRMINYNYSAVTSTSQTFNYDAVGNRTQLTNGGSVDNYVYATNSNRLTAITGAHPKNYTYTANGNLAGDGSRNYSYDARNRLVSANNSSYTHNGLGQRIKKYSTVAADYAPGDANGDNAYTTADRSVILNQILQLATAPGNPDCNQDSQITVQDLVCLNTLITGGAAPALSGTTLFVYNEPGHLIGEYNASGSVIQETVYLGNQPVAVLKQNNLYTIHTDHLNTPRAISDSGRTVVWRWDADPFGTAAADPDPDMNGVKFTYNLRFPGQYFDNETGLHYNYFRDYDPSTGRYIESDPVGLKGGINTYSYVGNNPLYWIDPLGLAAAVPMPAPVTIPGFRLPTPNPWWMLIYPKPAGEGSDIVPPGPYYNDKSRQSKPDGCPTGTVPIDQAKGKFKWDKDDVHGIKDGAYAGPKDWTGVSPDGHIWTGDGKGNAVDNGHWTGLIK